MVRPALSYRQWALTHDPRSGWELAGDEAYVSTGDRQIGFSVVPGERIYAVGDVHGCRQAFERLMHAVRQDTRARAPAVTRLVLLGDVVDRGPDTAAVLESVMLYAKASGRFTVLMGNHEQLMAGALEGDHETLALWLAVGGGDTLESFGVDAGLVREGATDALMAAAQKAVGVEIVTWLLRLPLTFRSGNVVFVHAGVRPGVTLERQEAKDLLWIREPFLSDDEPRDVLVVHGHTVHPEGADWRDYRIGIDTGAYKTGRLTALGLEGSSAWTLSSA